MSTPRRRARRRRRHLPPGSAPGTLSVDPAAPAPEVRVLAYDGEHLEEHGLDDLSRLDELRARHAVLWVDVTGLGDAPRLSEIAAAFGIHPLAMEDVVNLDQRPKAEPYDEQLFLVLRMVSPEGGEARDGPGPRDDASAPPADDEQLSMVLGPGVVVTFQERRGDCFAAVRDRLQRGGRLRRAGADYLAYALLDAVIDAYRPRLDGVLDELERLEAVLLEHPSFDPVPHLHGVRRRLNRLRHQVAPLRELLAALVRDEPGLVDRETALFLRDCQDHVAALMDGVESGRELVNGLVEMSVALVGRRLNEVMKVLTIIATLFIPLSFVAGVFGMNFDPDASPWNMPELRWRWGYPAALLLMALLAGGMLLWFRRKGWLGASEFTLEDHRPHSSERSS